MAVITIRILKVLPTNVAVYISFELYSWRSPRMQILALNLVINLCLSNLYVNTQVNGIGLVVSLPFGILLKAPLF